MTTGDGAVPLPTCYYNGACPVCRREIDHYRNGVDGDRVVWRDLGAEPEALAARGIDRATARRRLHVIDGDGRLHAGVDAFVLLWSALPRYRWLARLVAGRAVRPLADVLYERVLAPGLYHWNRRQGRT